MEKTTGLVERIGIILKAKGWKLCTVESCTGGLLAGRITAVPGASEYFDRGFITYSNESKIEILGVSSESIKTYGAVSDIVAREMAEGALKRSNAEVSISITGIAGPTGGSLEKPVGTVYIACATFKNSVVERYNFTGSREDIRNKAVEAGLELLWRKIQE
ncbi:MAG: CinA family protein [Syntrophobacterales bacterium]|nr:CinA family protein [Syntrophobacterales bacterium]